MAAHLNKTIQYDGRRYTLTGIHTRFEMFYAREEGRNFVTLIPFDVVTK